MKTKLFSWMTIMLMAFVCVGVTGCSKGGDDADDQEQVDPFKGGGTSTKVTKPVVSSMLLSRSRVRKNLSLLRSIMAFLPLVINNQRLGILVPVAG